MKVEEYSAEINRFHDTSSDVCSVSNGTMESYLHAKYMSDLVENYIVYKEEALNKSVENRADLTLPSLFDADHLYMREALIREKREEHPRAMNYSLRTGRVKRWYS